MNLAQDLDFFMAQGPVFWAAAASVGLGGALLVGSAFVWLRRRTGRMNGGFGRQRRDGSAPASTAAPTIEVTDTGYVVEGAPRAAAPVSPQPEADRAQLRDLLARLREAGDRLENALEVPESNDFLDPGLKPTLESDEIESRVGVC